MSKRRRSRSRAGNPFKVARKRSRLQTLVETVLGFGVALLVVAIAVWWIYIRKPSPKVVDKSGSTKPAIVDNVVDNLQSYQAVRDSGTLSQQLDLLEQLENWPRDSELPVKLETLNRRLEIAQTILAREDVDEETRTKTAKAAINTQGLLYGIIVDHDLGMNDSAFSDLLNLCNRFVNYPDPTVSREARITKTKALVTETTEGRMVDSPETMIDSLSELITLYPNDPMVGRTIQLLNAKVRGTNDELGVDLTRKILSAYQTQSIEDPVVQQIIRSMNDSLLLHDAKISELAKKGRETGDFELYLTELEHVIERPDTGVDFVNTVYGVIGYFESIGEFDLAKRLLLSLQKSAMARSDRRALEQAFRVAKFGLIRNAAVGKPFDFSDIDHAGNPVDVSRFDNRPVLLFFFSPHAPGLPTVIRKVIESCEFAAASNVQVLAIAVEKPSAPLEGLPSGWIVLSIDPVAGLPEQDDQTVPGRVFKRCPVTHVPYFAVVNRNGVLEALNVPMQNIKNVIELVASRVGS